MDQEKREIALKYIPEEVNEDSELLEEYKTKIKECFVAKIDHLKSVANETLTELKARDDFETDTSFFPSVVVISDKISREGKSMGGVSLHKDGTYSVKLAEWVLEHPKTTEEDVRDLVRHQLAHVICNKHYGENCKIQNHGDNWKEVVELLGMKDYERKLCVPKKYLTEEILKIAAKVENKKGKVVVPKDSNGKALPKWKLNCSEGCEIFQTRWGGKTVVKCKEHKLECDRYKRNDDDGTYELFEGTHNAFGFAVEDSIEVEDGDVVDENGNSYKSECISIDE